MKRILVASLGLAAPLMALAVPALAAPRDDVLYGISRCGGIADDRTWLDCLYGAAQPMRAQLGLAPAPVSQQKLVPPAMPGLPAPQAKNFGVPPPPPPREPGFFEQLATAPDDDQTKRTTMASYKFDHAGFFTVTFANGQTWRQDAGDAARAHWDKPARSYSVRIVPDPYNKTKLHVNGEEYLMDKVN